MARATFDIPEDRTLQGLRVLTTKQIRSELTRSRTTFNTKGLKADLLPLLALSKLGIVDEDNAADPALLVKVTRWCASLVSVLERELDDLGIKKGANKWFDIENLIRAEFIYESEDDEMDGVEGSDDQVPGQSNQVAVSATKFPSPSVLNLLLTLVYTDMGTYAEQFSAACPDCPVTSPNDLLKALDKTPRIKDCQHLNALCQQPTTKQSQIISWLSSTFGSDIVEATSESGLKIPGFPDSTHQFVLATPASTQRDNFAKQLQKAQGKSMLLFHGTPLRHLQSILRNGFAPAADRRFGAGVFMAEEPQYSSVYALKETYYELHDYGPRYSGETSKRWPHTPFKLSGALLGCEVTGKGRPVRSPGEPRIHVIKALDSVMIRYIFLVPTHPSSVGSVSEGTPQRAGVEQAMTAAFKIIHKGIMGKRDRKDKIEDDHSGEGVEEGESSMS